MPRIGGTCVLLAPGRLKRPKTQVQKVRDHEKRIKLTCLFCLQGAILFISWGMNIPTRSLPFALGQGDCTLRSRRAPIGCAHAIFMGFSSSTAFTARGATDIVSRGPPCITKTMSMIVIAGAEIPAPVIISMRGARMIRRVGARVSFAVASVIFSSASAFPITVSAVAVASVFPVTVAAAIPVPFMPSVAVFAMSSTV